MNLKDFEGATYNVIVVCLLANKFQGGGGGGGKTIVRGGECPSPPK